MPPFFFLEGLQEGLRGTLVEEGYRIPSHIFSSKPLWGSLSHIRSGLADRWQDIPGHPVLELLGLRLVRAKDQFVEAGLGDDQVGWGTNSNEQIVAVGAA